LYDGTFKIIGGIESI